MTSTTGKPRGPYARTARRREVIARAVLDIVLEKGHAAVTTAEVAERSDTREATVLYHYPTKDHLLVAALQYAEDEDVDAFPEPEAFELETLRTFVKITPRRVSLMRLYTALAGDATVPGHPAQTYFTAHYERVLTWFARLIELRQSAGLAHPGLDPQDTARQIVAVWDGLQAQWLVASEFDLGESLMSAFRRLTGENWMEARSRIVDDPDAGL